MSLLMGVVIFAMISLLWAWILFCGGADYLESSFLSAFLVSTLAPWWSAEGIKLFVALIWLFERIWLAIGLFVPEARL